MKNKRNIYFFVLMGMLLLQSFPAYAKIPAEEILDIIKQNYVEEINQENLYEKALNKLKSYSPESTVINKLGLNDYNVICRENHYEFVISEGDVKNYDRFSEIFKKCTTKASVNKPGYDIDQMAMNLLIESLDPHSSFMTADMYKELETETRGSFGGVGIEITLQKDVLTVVSPIDNTPAFKAGIRAGDQIIMIDGQSTKGITIPAAVKKLRGKSNTKVALTIIRATTDKQMDFVLTRDVIKIRSVKSEVLNNNIGYIRLSSFQESTTENLKRALRDFKEKDHPLKGLILDMRNNPGGLLNQAVKVSDIFLKSGTIVSTRGRSKNMESKALANNDGDEFLGPIITLVNQGTASAAEIVAGALQDNGRSLIIGTQTFGKGSVQTVITLGDGSALKLTTAKYYKPKGQVVQDVGITPNVIIGKIQGIREKDLSSINKPDFPKTDTLSRDDFVYDSERQLKESIQLLEMVIAANDMGKGLQDYQKKSYASFPPPLSPPTKIKEPSENNTLDSTPPVILITSPKVLRGIKLTAKDASITVIGNATDESGVATVTVNGETAALDANGNFSAEVLLKVGENRIIVAATDIRKNTATETFTLVREAGQVAKAKLDATQSAMGIGAGKYYGLIIGNNNYRHITRLQTAVNDATMIEKLLKESYGFESRLLLNATRKDILSAINEFRNKLAEKDNLLIYYAGHGEFDRSAEKAYWLPVDALRDDPTDWIIADDITSSIKRLSSKHVLIVSDSCYSGTLTRSAQTSLINRGEREEFLKKMAIRSSRTLMASGGNEPVADSGGSGHSIFADSFLKALKEIENRYSIYCR